MSLGEPASRFGRVSELLLPLPYDFLVSDRVHRPSSFRRLLERFKGQDTGLCSHTIAIKLTRKHGHLDPALGRRPGGDAVRVLPHLGTRHEPVQAHARPGEARAAPPL